MPVDIRGNQYHTVAERVEAFRQQYGIQDGWGIRTEVVELGELVVFRAGVVDPEGRTVGEGYAEEVRGSSPINKTSALENCETSAIGRALASAGFGGGGEYASADEVAGAIEALGSRETSAARRKGKGKASGGSRDTERESALLEQLQAYVEGTVGNLDQDKRVELAEWLQTGPSIMRLNAMVERLGGQQK